MSQQEIQRLKDRISELEEACRITLDAIIRDKNPVPIVKLLEAALRIGEKSNATLQGVQS